jgi:hypothetical protein
MKMKQKVFEFKTYTDEEITPALIRKMQMTAMLGLLDLIGSFQAVMQHDNTAHDWEAHLSSIDDIAEVFGMEALVPDDLTDYM